MALAYLVAVSGSGLVMAARLAPEGSSRSFWASLAFLCAVSAAGAMGGWKPGFLTTALSVCGAAFFLVRPYYSFRVSSTSDLLRIAGSAVVGIAISILCEALHRAWARIEEPQQRLEQALQQLRIVTDSMSASIAHCSRDLKYLWVSKPYADWLGLPAETIVGRPIAEIVGREAFEQMRFRFEQVLAGKSVQYEEVVDYKGLGPRWINGVYTPTFDARGSADGWVAVILDFTERRHVEEALRRSEERFARFMQFLPGSAWIKDLNGRYVYANDAAVTIFDRSRESLYDKRDQEVFPAQVAAQFAENDRKALTSQTGVQLIETLEHSDGVVHHSLVSKFPILGPEQRPAFIGGIAIDITDRLQAEKVRAESEERFRQLAETINEVFWMVDLRETKILYISPAYERVWGRTCQSLYDEPRSFIEAVHPDDKERVQAAAVERQSRGESTDEEYRIVTPEGSVRWIRNRAFPVKDAEGQVFRMAGIAEDITEKKRAEEALKQADRRKDEFLATLAHELRNPLAPICNAVELIQFAEGNPSAVEEARTVLKRQLGHLVRLVDDLLEISRITSGKLQLRKERIEFAAAVHSAVEATRPLVAAAGHELTISLPPEPIYLDADSTRLAQILSNLLNNAAKYAEKGGHIWLTAERQGDSVTVSVRDTGIGIAAEHLAHIFEMFSQALPALERSQGGLGIGLALVRGLVELHGGTIEAQSDGPGQGSEFTIRLPVASGPDRPSLPEQLGKPVESIGPTPKSRILVVDDNPDTTATLALILERRGHHVHVAHDGLEAVHAAAAFRPDVVLLDIGLPKLNGYEVAQRIRQQRGANKMALVAVTGWGQQEDRRRAMEAGFDHHLTKPVDVADLMRLLALVVNRP
ncbi:MAG TPA: PAS domain-containing protein [Planctomycetaceae bacterium]|nr:PAS domain-containing protein [Planctomycetaceae bacterium]